MPKKRKYVPSMADLARETGVSIATVSRVLKGDSRISESTKAKVGDAAERLGYSQNLLVEGIRGAGSRSVGVLLCVEDFYVDVFRGIESALWKKGRLPLVGSFKRGEVSEREALDSFISHRVEGVIVRPVVYADIVDSLSKLKARGLPIVLLDTEMPGVDLPFSGSDDFAGGRLAAERMISLGHKVVGHLQGYKLHSASIGRRDGFLSCRAEHPDVLFKLGPENDGALSDERAWRSLMDSSPRPTAVFAYNDHLAAAICKLAARDGLRVPEDLSVLGFGDLPLAKLSSPALSTFNQTPELIGVNAVELLFNEISGVRKEARRLAVPTFVPRESERRA